MLNFLKREQKRDAQFIQNNIADLCASIQKTIVSILINKLKKAVAQTGIKTVCLAGGVSANSGLRSTFEATGRQLGWTTFVPPFQYCTDNAAMIAITAYYKYQRQDFAPLSIAASARAAW